MRLSIKLSFSQHSPTVKKLFHPRIKSEVSLDQKNLLGISMLLLLAVDFIFGYFLHTYYAKDLLNPETAGFWLQLANYLTIAGIMLINKWILPWSWQDLGMGKLKTWWKPLLIAALTFMAVYLFALYLQPVIIDAFGPHQGIEFLNDVKGNLPVLISSLCLTWFTAAFFLEEVIFRAFFLSIRWICCWEKTSGLYLPH